MTASTRGTVDGFRWFLLAPGVLPVTIRAASTIHGVCAFRLVSAEHAPWLRDRNPGMRSTLRCVKWQIAALMLISLGLHLWGIRRDLPYSEEYDENFFVPVAIDMVARGSLNPEWFGNPGSTLIYPLTLLYRIGHAVVSGGAWIGPEPGLSSAFRSSPALYYMAGRLLCVVFAVSSIPLLYAVGRRSLGVRAALIGCFLYILLPLPTAHAQMVRTDSPGVFFGLLALWSCFRLRSRPTLTIQLLAGAAIGLAIATRYFMVALVPVLLVVNFLNWREGRYRGGRAAASYTACGLTTVFLGFALSTPYFFLDFETVRSNLLSEARGSHVGADGLSRLGNFAWYWSQSFPKNLTWPVFLVALCGWLHSIRRGARHALLFSTYVLVFLVGISLSSLHWDRWTIQVLPILTLFAGAGLASAFRHFASPRKVAWIVVLLLGLVPGYQTVLQNIRQYNPSTRVLARQWMIGNVPSGSVVYQEFYSAPLKETSFVTTMVFSLAVAKRVDYFRHKRVPYLMISSDVYGRYYKAPDRHPDEVRFYDSLEKDAELLQEFRPTRTTGGPVIRVYRLADLNPIG